MFKGDFILNEKINTIKLLNILTATRSTERLFPADASVISNFPWTCDFEGASNADGQPKCGFSHGRSTQGTWTERQLQTDTADTGPEEGFTGLKIL